VRGALVELGVRCRSHRGELDARGTSGWQPHFTEKTRKSYQGFVTVGLEDRHIGQNGGLDTSDPS
jgi:hypothetical protein